MPSPSFRLIPPVLLPIMLVQLLLPIMAQAAEQFRLSITLKDHRFTPAHLTVPAGQRFLIELINRDSMVAEFESYDMKFEKIVVASGTVTVHAGPLKPGTYKFFDDYHPETTGTVTAAKVE